ncbi:MAG: TIGR02757 family protein [Sedimentisphaerales bacterium]
MKSMAAISPTDASAAKAEKLKALFEGLYKKYNRKELIKPDPLQFIYRYSDPADMEIVGLLSACLAYGRVEQIQNDLNDLLGRMGNSPYEFMLNFTNKDRALLEDFKHRFNTGNDISDLLTLLKDVLAEHGSIEKYFMLGLDPAHENTIFALMRFCDSLLDKYRMTHQGRRSKGLAFLLAGPGLGGAAKRLNLFLRWMVRSDDVDAGLWRSVDKSKLIVPVDVHIARLCRILGFHSHKNVSLKTAIEITRNFALISTDDPVKYDFALSRIGILEDCTGKRREQCNVCELLPWCRNRKDW